MIIDEVVEIRNRRDPSDNMASLYELYINGIFIYRLLTEQDAVALAKNIKLLLIFRDKRIDDLEGEVDALRVANANITRELLDSGIYKEADDGD